MSFLLKLALLILLNAADCHDADIEIVLLPLWNSKNSVEVPLTFKVFGQLIELTLRRNDKIVAPNFQVWKHSTEGTTEKLVYLSRPEPCHYLHQNRASSAAISLCRERGLHGLVFLENVALEITPIEIPSGSSSPYDHYISERSEVLGEPHIVKRSRLSANMESHNEIFEQRQKLHETKTASLVSELLAKLGKRRFDEVLSLELAVFFDQAGYDLFSPFLDHDDSQIRDMLLAYVNGIQALYHHPSLGVTMDISLVRLDIMQKQPRDLPHFDGERGGLLDSFCNYAKTHNPLGDDHPDHWDMGLYVSGLDFYAFENGKRNSGTMGLATVGGLCLDHYSCVIAELGVTNRFGKPYPSAGFTSVYVAAHEIGHNLGMHHDSTGNACPKDGYIMSPSRGTQGETIWSECSRDVAQKLPWTKPCLLDKPTHRNDNLLDHGRFLDLPGREWTSKRQCEFLLRDKDATVATLHGACQSLQCKTPHRSGYYLAGPALEGTHCAPGKECRGGECALSDRGTAERPGGWSEWKTEECTSGCLLRSKGARARRRTCDAPPARNTLAGCLGQSYDVVLCRDDGLCKRKRRTAVEFASVRCAEFSESLPELDSKGGGLQARHEHGRPWMACAIFCRRKDIASYYTPRVELNDLGLDPYFPDGTWCHAEDGQDYFCRRHHCLPEDFRFGKKLPADRPDEDVEFGPQNARPAEGSGYDDHLVKYFGLGPDGLPLLTSLPPALGTPREYDDEWTDKDYIELTEPTMCTSDSPCRDS
ncbi:hypothetical protein KM043_010147 [Ampulex compressa]|nr:hypothetical protein KM043_010147 [Ampulex compressa]